MLHEYVRGVLRLPDGRKEQLVRLPELREGTHVREGTGRLMLRGEEAVGQAQRGSAVRPLRRVERNQEELVRVPPKLEPVFSICVACAAHAAGRPQLDTLQAGAGARGTKT